MSDTQFPERDESTPAEQQGLFHKFDVRRVDGSDLPGGKHHGCRYFVLDMDHDAHAPAALRAYAASCAATHPQLSADLTREFAKVDADECARDVYEQGESIGLFDIPKGTANAICAGIMAVTGMRIDWHYVAGRVHMMALAAPQPQGDSSGLAECAKILKRIVDLDADIALIGERLEADRAARALLAKQPAAAVPELHAALMELYKQVKDANEETDLNPIFEHEINAITILLNGDLFTAAAPSPATGDEREAAEAAYSDPDFNYERGPIGSHDWRFYHAGWKAKAALAASPAGAEDARDAARYRWLRESERLGDDDLDGQIVTGAAGAEDLLWGEQMDNAIDAAMRASKEDA